MIWLLLFSWMHFILIMQMGQRNHRLLLRKAQDYLRDATIEELRMQGWFRSDTYQLLDEESQEFMESLEEKNGRWKPFRKEAFWGGFVCCQCH